MISYLRECYLNWLESAPKNGGSCCSGQHYEEKGRPLADHLVCAREITWRRYVRARDNSNFPFTR